MKLLVVLACLCSAVVVGAQNGPPRTVADRAKAAGRVLVAQVLDVQSRFAKSPFGDELIVSDLVLDVSETLKGPEAKVVKMTIEGGTVGGLTLRVSDLPSFKAGDRGVFFLDVVNGTLVPHDRGLGLLKVSMAGLVEGSAVSIDDVRRQVSDALGGGR